MTQQPATAQEIFDFVATHLFTQGVRSVDPDGGCAYRGHGALKCAIGCRISDEEYSYEMEGFSADILVERFPNLSSGEIRYNEELYSSLQCVHDEECHWETADAMRTALQIVARRHELSPAILGSLHFPEART